MKTLTALMLLGSISAFADTSKNPDRMPSIGLDVSTTRQNVSLNAQELVDLDKQQTAFAAPNSTLIAQQITIDFRAPLSNLVTVSFHGGPNTTEYFGNKQGGYSVGAGIRVYLPWLAQ